VLTEKHLSSFILLVLYAHLTKVAMHEENIIMIAVIGN
jgi:hypothetical protein